MSADLIILLPDYLYLQTVEKPRSMTMWLTALELSMQGPPSLQPLPRPEMEFHQQELREACAGTVHVA